MLLPTTLCLGAAAAVINFWLGMRCARARMASKIFVGDGGDDLLIRRMRAQSNFIENVPLTLILIAAIELAGKGSWWLAPAGAVFLLGRIAHAFGMDSDAGFKPGRPIGMMTAMLLQLALVITAVLAALGKI